MFGAFIISFLELLYFHTVSNIGRKLHQKKKQKKKKKKKKQLYMENIALG